LLRVFSTKALIKSYLLNFFYNLILNLHKRRSVLCSLGSFNRRVLNEYKDKDDT
jgi:hypothetical protein